MNSITQKNAQVLANLAQAPQMLNAPTVVPVMKNTIPAGRKVADTDPYYSIEVDTTALTEAAEIVLFDGSQGYQFGANASMPLGVVIKGRTANYQFILNDIVHNSSYINMIRLQVYAPNGGGDNCCDSNDIAMIQFSNAVDVYDSSKGARPRRIDTIYPDMGISEQQYWKNISSFQKDVTITNRTALVYTQEPGIRVVWSFYQAAELGRHQ